MQTPLTEKGVALAGLKKFDEAIKSFAKVVSQDPGMPSSTFTAKLSECQKYMNHTFRMTSTLM